MEILGLNPSLFWFILGVVFLVLEAMTPGFFLLFFGVGAWVTGALVFFLPIPQSLQWAIFIVVSVAALIIMRRKLKTMFQKGPSPVTALDDPIFGNQYLGREAMVIKDINPASPGQVELNGTNWQARTQGEAIVTGQMVRVVGLDGLTLLVVKSN